MKKKLLAVGLISLLVLPVVTFAASQGYSSYLVLPPQQRVDGKSRSYDYSKHKVSIAVDKVLAPAEPRYVVITINKKNLIGSSQKKRTSVFYNEGDKLNVEMGNQGTGKFWYGYGSYQNAYTNDGGYGLVYAGLESDDVVMTSYN